MEPPAIGTAGYRGKHARLMVGAVLLCATLGYGEQNKCADLTKFQMAGLAATITKAEVHAAETAANGIPTHADDPHLFSSYCRADGIMEPRAGIDGKQYSIGFAVVLPDNWNGRFLFQGGGALNGHIQEPLGTQSSGKVPALSRGFAIVATDSGHQGAPFDASFFRDQQASLNFAYIAVGKVTLAAKAIVAQYYGKPAHHSYFDGCSTGGREGC